MAKGLSTWARSVKPLVAAQKRAKMDRSPFIESESVAMTKSAETRLPIHPILAERWSPRGFDPARPVTHEQLVMLFEAARWAPSSLNLQPWHFIVAQRHEEIAFARMLACINEGNRAWASNAAILIITVASMLRREDVPNRHAYHDVGLAMGNLLAQATAMGLSGRLMGGFNPDAARELYRIPAGYEAVTALALGYRAAPEALPQDIRDRDLAPRVRKPLEAFVFSGDWGQPAALDQGEEASVG